MTHTIDVHISQLLFDHECVVVSGFGAFLTRCYPAEINMATNMLRPPSRRVHFNSRINEDDGILARHISRSENISYAQALESIAISVRGWQRMLSGGKKVNLPGVGRLYLNNEHKIQFNPAIDINYHKASFGLEIFRSPQVYREIEINRSIQKAIEIRLPAKSGAEKEKRNTAFIRWAAILAPFVGLGIAAGVYLNDPVSFPGNVAGLPPFITTSSHDNRGVTEETDPGAAENETPVLHKVPTPSSPEKMRVPARTGEIPAKTIPAGNETFAPFHIIVGSFKNSDNAQNYVKELKARGFAAYIAAGDQRYTRVAIGNYPNRETASTDLLMVKREINPGSWIYAN